MHKTLSLNMCLLALLSHSRTSFFWSPSQSRSVWGVVPYQRFSYCDLSQYLWETKIRMWVLSKETHQEGNMSKYLYTFLW